MASDAAASVAAVGLDRVSFRYPGSGAGVRDVSLALPRASSSSASVRRGCGKTTLLRSSRDSWSPSSGTLRLSGTTSTTPAASRECGVVFQSYALFPHMRVWENVAYPLRVRGVDAARAAARALAMLELGRPRRARGAPAGAALRRPAAARGAGRALVFEPHALLLDEPLSALDAATRIDHARRDPPHPARARHRVAAHHARPGRGAVARRSRDRDCATAASSRTRRRTRSTTRPPTTSSPTSSGRANLIEGERRRRFASTRRSAASRRGRTGAAGRARAPPGAPRAGRGRRRGGRRERLRRAGRRDRFFGASRRVEAAVGAARLEIETMRAILSNSSASRAMPSSSCTTPEGEQ